MMSRKSYRDSHFLLLLAALAIIGVINGEYLIGVGSYDMTGPAAEVNMMGYASMEQNSAGVHFRLRARTFIVADQNDQRARFAFVNLDAGMASQLVTVKVLERLRSRYGTLYTKENLAISGIHTHAGPGGYLQYLLYHVTSLGFVQQSFDALVNAIEQSVVQAHENLKPGSVFINTGDVENAGINRSPSAYLLNPAEERARYPANVDKEMTLLKFVDSASGKSIGAFSWYATHGTSMSRDNKLISGDNKGAAARFFEDWFTSTESNSSRSVPTPSNISKLIKKVRSIKATGGKPCDNSTSRSFKARKSDGSQFVGAFCQSNVGDISPNVLGAFCTDSGKPCDFNHSSCHGDVTLCKGRGPGYPDDTLSTKIIGERQFNKAVDLFMSATKELTGKVDYRHVYQNFSEIEVELSGKTKVRTCPAALGPGFAAGTTDGPGMFGFQQGDTEINELWKKVRDLLKEPSQFQVECQKPKAVLLSSGEMFEPYAWTAASTLYGPHTLSAYIQEFNHLALAMAKGRGVLQPADLSPPDLSSKVLRLLADPFPDSLPGGKKFGDIKQDVSEPKGGSFKKGNRPSATFWSANARNDLLTEGTFAAVEMLQGQRWIPVYDDDDFCLYFKWKLDNSSLYTSLATIEWEVPEEASSGVYRLRHFGSSKKAQHSPIEYFTGASSAFTVS
ncbi:hypothetical protein POPTR_002G013300v4 [Populus trichocarpa]|uniref:Uncharacterized protein n=2 Tax=Populus trichocarpa TaxID=3694 RepID=A0ACC0TBF7_POPTR|nr:hypothetical protein POPTR_002G013300v4 [Populus trichocarpa]